MRRFKRTIEPDRLWTELRAREFYEKTNCRTQASFGAAVKRHYKRIRRSAIA